MAQLQTTAEVLDNEIYNCAVSCVQVSTTGSAANTVIRGNLLHTTTTGVPLSNNTTGSIFDHDTVADISSTGLLLGSRSTRISIRINAIVDAPVGINANEGQIATEGGNLFWNNSTSARIGCTLDATSTIDDPLFVSPGTGDYRPATGSPLING